MTTSQEEAWKGEFGKTYTERNTYDPVSMDAYYLQLYGVSRTDLNRLFLRDISIHAPILEVGCGTGNQLRMLKMMGFQNLHGVDINEGAVIEAAEYGFDVQVASALELPFDDGTFELVYTSGVLIHIGATDLDLIMREILRVSQRLIWGLEYYSFARAKIKYREQHDMLWKDNFASHYANFGHIMRQPALLRELRMVRLDGSGVDTMFLLRK